MLEILYNNSRVQCYCIVYLHKIIAWQMCQSAIKLYLICTAEKKWQEVVCVITNFTILSNGKHSYGKECIE